MRLTATIIMATACTAGPARAVDVEVFVTGVVEFNLIGAPPLGNVEQGDPAMLRFVVDSTSFVNGASFPTRGYDIDQSSFLFDLGSASIDLQSPFPAGATPYFVIRNDDPAVDGFLISTNVAFPVGVPLDQAGGSGQFTNDFSVTYGGATLPSLDILDAVGSYDFTGLTVFNWTIDDGPVNALGIVFSTLSIAPFEPCNADIAAPPDDEVDVVDLLMLLSGWGPCARPCPGIVCRSDVNGDCTVDVVDLLELLAAWGPCPGVG